jgi:ssDNA-binding Zn-finger/Zn-ribbon topoisomerase 1
MKNLGIPKNKPTTLECPTCKDFGRGTVHLVVRQNNTNGNYFLACPMYPECNYTHPITEEIKMRAQGQKELFT